MPDLESLIREELGEEPRPAGKNWLTHPPRDLIGLALSGGGIRSATFNLGLLQGLNHFGLLKSFDYLSTVSGGSYIGSFWIRWRDQHWRSRSHASGRSVFPTGATDGQTPEPRSIRHLREFSNFLAPRLGIFSYDTGRLLVTAVSSMVPSLLAALSLLTLTVLFWTLLAWLLFGSGIRTTGIWWELSISASAITVALMTLLTLILFEVFWSKRKEVGSLRAYAVAGGLALLGVVGAWTWILGHWEADLTPPS
jgi:hypothetical protein